MSARIATSKVLLIQYGPTMTLDQFRAAFMPGVVIKTIRNKIARGDLPAMRGEVFDSQEIGDWWEGLAINAESAPVAASFNPLARYDDVVAKAVSSAVSARQPVVYLLLSGEEIVYVGMSMQHFGRISAHIHHGEKGFDRVAMIHCAAQDVFQLEAQLIAKFRPKYNIAGVPNDEA